MMSFNRGQGFTLIEVVVALAVAAVALIALMQTASGYARNTAYLRDKVFANWVANNVLNELLLETQYPDEGEETGEYEMVGKKWHWKVRVTELSIPEIRRIDITVYQNERKTRALFSTVSFATNLLTQ